MAAVELGDDPDPPSDCVDQHPLNQQLFERFESRCRSISFPSPRGLCCGVSAQAYNVPEHYYKLIAAVKELWQ